MRFGKWDRGRPLLGRSRRAASVQKGVAEGPVAVEERSALLHTGTAPTSPPPMPAPASMTEPEAVNPNDPTRRLLTILNRFQRHASRAEEGVEQDEWSDDCMNELIAATKIAVHEDWADVLEALGGTGRILQTYEDAGCAHLCVRFLNDSYNILCLMVGGLMGGAVRPAVMTRWRNRYNSAVVELESAGLVLIPDGEGQDEDPGEAPPVPVQIHLMEALDEPAPAEPAQPPAPIGVAPIPPEPLADDAASSEKAFTFPVPTTLSGHQMPPATMEESAVNDVPDLDIFPVDREEEPPEPPPLPSAPQPPAPQAVAPSPKGITPEAAGILDALCDDLAAIEKPEGDMPVLLESIRTKVGGLEGHARSRDREQPAALCQTMASLCGHARRSGLGRDEQFLNAAYGFCEAFAEAMTGEESVLARTWADDAAGLLDAWEQPAAEAAAPVPVRAPEPAATPEPLAEAEVPPEAEEAPEAPVPPEGDIEDDTLRALLQSAQRAIAEGQVGDAKLLVLQAAATLAKVETVKAELSVRQAEVQIQEDAAAIERARERVKEAEQGVVAADKRVSECKRTEAETRAHIEQLEASRQETEQRVAQLDARIRQLQTQRDTDNKRLEQVAEEHGATCQRRADLEVEEKQLVEAVQAARVGLENTRQEVKNLQRKRSDMESTLAQTREMLNKHQASLADIEQTIAQVRGDAKPPAEAEPLLF